MALLAPPLVYAELKLRSMHTRTVLCTECAIQYDYLQRHEESDEDNVIVIFNVLVGGNFLMPNKDWIPVIITITVCQQ